MRPPSHLVKDRRITIPQLSSRRHHQCRSGSPAELRNSDGPCKLGGKEITIQNGDGLCVAASGTKNGKRIIAEKCKAGSSKQQWQIGPM